MNVASSQRRDFNSLGTNAEYTAAFIGEVPFFLEVNERMPHTYGENQLHISELAGWIHTDRALTELPHSVPDQRDHQIAAYVAERIRDGSCLQVGVGKTPNALLSALADHRELGVHTEALSDGIMDLIERGAVTGSRKREHRNKHVTTFCVGSQRLFDFLDHNGSVALLPVDQVGHRRAALRRRHPDGADFFSGGLLVRPDDCVLNPVRGNHGVGSTQAI